MKKKILQNIECIYSFDNNKTIYKTSDIYIENGIIKDIGQNIAQHYVDDSIEIISCRGLTALPGFINTHHHLYQTLFRGIQEVQEKPLFPWLKGLYEFWKYIDEESVYYGAMIGFSELLRTGCTCTSDHHYLFPANVSNKLIDIEIEAARKVGIRFHPTRGSMSLSVRDGGLPPESVVQTDEEILLDSERLIQTYHDPSPYSMTQIALAPCSPFSVTPELMRESARLARKHGVLLHTHLAETLDEEKFCIDRFGKRPFELMDSLEWIGNDVWFAHGIHFNNQEIKALKGVGIAHCPSSNMKLSSGICRLNELKANGIKVSLAVDGSASNDGSNMMEELHRMYLLNHLKYGSDSLSAYDCIEIATRGGADVLHRTKLGQLGKGMAADLILLDLNGIEYAGCHDPLVSIISLGNQSFTKMTIVNGEIVSKNNKLTQIDSLNLAYKAHVHAQKLVARKRAE